MTTPEYPNPGLGYGYKSSPDYKPHDRSTHGSPWPPEAVSNGTKPIDRKARVAAENRVRAFLAARSNVNHNDLITGADPAYAPGADLYASDLLTLLGPDFWAGDGAPPDTGVTVTAKPGPGREDEVAEDHESFGYAKVSNVSSTGQALFGSDITHQHYVVLSVGRNRRYRSHGRDRYFNTEELVEVGFSIAQWGQLVSSFNQGSGVPCTIMRTAEQGLVPGAPHAPRLAESTAEVKASATKALANITEAVAALVDDFNANGGRKVLRSRVEEVARLTRQAPGNIAYTTKVLDDHVEQVVNGAAADIEAMVNDRARQLGIDPAVVLHGLTPGAQGALGAGDEDQEACDG
jgi:hypothetical protein